MPLKGRKLLVFYFGLSADVIAQMHAAIKSVMPFCEKALLSEFGEVCLGLIELRRRII